MQQWVEAPVVAVDGVTEAARDVGKRANHGDSSASASRLPKSKKSNRAGKVRSRDDGASLDEASAEAQVQLDRRRIGRSVTQGADILGMHWVVNPRVDMDTWVCAVCRGMLFEGSHAVQGQ